MIVIILIKRLRTKQLRNKLRKCQAHEYYIRNKAPWKPTRAPRGDAPDDAPAAPSIEYVITELLLL